MAYQSYEDKVNAWWNTLPLGHHIHIRLTPGVWVRAEVVVYSRDGDGRYALAYDIVVAPGIDAVELEAQMPYEITTYWHGTSSRVPKWYKELPKRSYKHRFDAKDIFESPWYAFDAEATSPVGISGKALFARLGDDNVAYSSQAIAHAKQVDAAHISDSAKFKVFAKDSALDARPKMAINAQTANLGSGRKVELVPEISKINKQGSKLLGEQFQKNRNQTLAIGFMWLIAVVCGFVVSLAWYAVILLLLIVIGSAAATGVLAKHTRKAHTARSAWIEKDDMDYLHAWCEQNKLLENPTVSQYINEGRQAINDLALVPSVTQEDYQTVASFTRQRINHLLAMDYLSWQKDELDEKLYQAYQQRLEKESATLAANIQHAKKKIVQLRLHEMMKAVSTDTDSHMGLDALLQAYEIMDGPQVKLADEKKPAAKKKTARIKKQQP